MRSEDSESPKRKLDLLADWDPILVCEGTLHRVDVKREYIEEFLRNPGKNKKLVPFFPFLQVLLYMRKFQDFC